MKKFIIVFIFFVISSNSFAENKIVYLDVSLLLNESIVGQNLGARQTERITETFKKAISTGFILLTIVAIILFFTSELSILFIIPFNIFSWSVKICSALSLLFVLVLFNVGIRWPSGTRKYMKVHESIRKVHEAYNFV